MRIANHRLQRDSGEAVRFMNSPNCGGTLRPSYLVMHYTAGRSADSAASWLCKPLAKAAAHLVIGKDGKVIQCVPFDIVAWHAGQSSWKDESGKTLVGMNRHSIGIELDNAGRVVRQGGKWRSLALGTTYPDTQVVEATHKHESKPSGWVVYPTAQLECAREVAALLINTYGLNDVLGHEDIAKGRKSDPGPAFPMSSFKSQLFGRASDDPLVVNIRVTTKFVNVRGGPGTNFDPVIRKPLPVGTRVEVLATEGVWQRVDVLDAVDGVVDVHGWVHGRYLGEA